MSPGRIKIRVIKTVKRQYVSPKIDCRLRDKCPAEKSFLSECGHTRARARACTRSHHVVDTRSSVERRMIELYLNHRDRLINILDMIDGKERSVCAHLSKIGHRNVSPITGKCTRARAREREIVYEKKKKKRAIDPWSRTRGGFEKG